MENKKIIDEFNEANRPFYIVDHGNGEYSLCLVLSFLWGDLKDYGQEAFNAYAREIGEPVVDALGFYTHGDGYEWEAVFRKAFENDPNIGEIKYDCEAGGFFCYSKNLATLADFGSRFKTLIDDTEEFTKVCIKLGTTIEIMTESFIKFCVIPENLPLLKAFMGKEKAPAEAGAKEEVNRMVLEQVYAITIRQGT